MEESATPTITQKRHTDFSVTFCFDSFVGRKIFPAQKNDAIRLKHIKITDKMNAVTQPHYDVATAIPPSVRILCSGFLDDENNISFDGYSCDATVSLREDESEDWSFASTSSLNKRRTSTKFNNDSGHEVNPAAVAKIMNWLSASEKEEAASCSSYAYYKMSKNASIPPNDNSTPIIEARNSAASSMVVRYLISEKGDIVVALKKLRSTLKWRKEQNIDLLRDCFESSDPLAIKFRERIRHFVGLTGKLVVSGYDKEHRACWHTIGRRSPPGTQSDHEGCMLSHFYFLERALACSEAKSLKEGWKVPQGKVIVSVDFGGFKKHHAPLMSTVKELLHGLLNHYPERLFRVYLVGPPLVFCCLWKMVAPFIDEKTKEKFQFLTKERATKVFEEAVGKDECLPYQHEKGKLSDEFDMDDFFLAIPFDECY